MLALGYWKPPKNVPCLRTATGRVRHHGQHIERTNDWPGDRIERQRPWVFQFLRTPCHGLFFPVSVDGCAPFDDRGLGGSNLNNLSSGAACVRAISIVLTAGWG